MEEGKISIPQFHLELPMMSLYTSMLLYFSNSFSSSHVQMWELDYKESWALKNWWFWTVMLEKTLESPLDCKEIQPVNPKESQSCIFIGRTDADAEAEAPTLCPPDVKNSHNLIAILQKNLIKKWA